MATIVHGRIGASRVAAPAWEHWAWFASGAAGAFLVPFVFSDWLGLKPDLYYLVYFSAVAGFFGAYLRFAGISLPWLFTLRWQWSIGLGIAAALFVVANVMSSDATPRPGGADFVWAIAWRGVIYGAVDALLLSAFPALVAWSALGRDLNGWGRRVRFAATALALTVMITATYHLGYPQYRDDGPKRGGLGGPEIGNTVMSVPAVLALNPFGSIGAHVAMHVTSVVHSYETDIFLPPQTAAD